MEREEDGERVIAAALDADGNPLHGNDTVLVKRKVRVKVKKKVRKRVSKAEQRAITPENRTSEARNNSQTRGSMSPSTLDAAGLTPYTQDPYIMELLRNSSLRPSFDKHEYHNQPAFSRLSTGSGKYPEDFEPPPVSATARIPGNSPTQLKSHHSPSPSMTNKPPQHSIRDDGSNYIAGYQDPTGENLDNEQKIVYFHKKQEQRENILGARRQYLERQNWEELDKVERTEYLRLKYRANDWQPGQSDTDGQSTDGQSTDIPTRKKRQSAAPQSGLSGTRSSSLDPSLIYETDHAHRYPKAKFLLDDGAKPDIPFSEERANSLFGKAKYVKIKKRTTNPKKDQAKPYEIVYRIIDPKELAGWYVPVESQDTQNTEESQRGSLKLKGTPPKYAESEKRGSKALSYISPVTNSEATYQPLGSIADEHHYNRLASPDKRGSPGEKEEEQPYQTDRVLHGRCNTEGDVDVDLEFKPRSSKQQAELEFTKRDSVIRQDEDKRRRSSTKQVDEKARRSSTKQVEEMRRESSVRQAEEKRRESSVRQAEEKRRESSVRQAEEMRRESSVRQAEEKRRESSVRQAEVANTASRGSKNSVSTAAQEKEQEVQQTEEFDGAPTVKSTRDCSVVDEEAPGVVHEPVAGPGIWNDLEKLEDRQPYCSKAPDLENVDKSENKEYRVSPRPSQGSMQSEPPKQRDELTEDIIDDMIRELKHERDSKSKLAETNQSTTGQDQDKEGTMLTSIAPNVPNDSHHHKESGSFHCETTITTTDHDLKHGERSSIHKSVTSNGTRSQTGGEKVDDDRSAISYPETLQEVADESNTAEASEKEEQRVSTQGSDRRKTESSVHVDNTERHSLPISDKLASEPTEKSRSIDTAATDGGSIKPPISETAPTEKPASNPSNPTSENQLSDGNQQEQTLLDEPRDKAVARIAQDMKHKSSSEQNVTDSTEKIRKAEQRKSMPDVDDSKEDPAERDFASALDNRSVTPDPYRSVPDVAKPEALGSRPSIVYGSEDSFHQVAGDPGDPVQAAQREESFHQVIDDQDVQVEVADDFRPLSPDSFTSLPTDVETQGE